MAFLYLYMMKLFILVIFSFFAAAGFAQERPLSTDDRGKLIFYEVVDLNGIPRDSLIARASAFFSKSKKMLKIKSASGDSSIQAAGKLIINKTALVLSRPSGEILYNFYVETKEGKYRFWLTDFNFIPYQRDRYGNFVASTTVGTPLENSPGKLNAAEWSGYIKAATREINVLAGRFKDAMMKKVADKPVVKPAAVSPRQKW